jgi:hypothetical protein
MTPRQLARYLDRLRKRACECELCGTRWADQGDMVSAAEGIGEGRATRWVIQELESFLKEALNISEKVSTGKDDEQ